MTPGAQQGRVPDWRGWDPVSHCRVGMVPTASALSPKKLISDAPASCPPSLWSRALSAGSNGCEAPDGPRWRRAQEGLWFLPQLPHPSMAGKMLGGLLLLAAAPGVLGTASLQNLHLCEGYVGPDDRYHPGFYCPRLMDPATHRYCCQPGPHALKGCCSRLGMEVLTGLNITGLPAPSLLRHPLALPFVGLYGLLVLLLMALDLAHFYRTQRCTLDCRLPRAPCLPYRTPSPAASAPRAAGVGA